MRDFAAIKRLFEEYILGCISLALLLGRLESMDKCVECCSNGLLFEVCAKSFDDMAMVCFGGFILLAELLIVLLVVLFD